MLMMKLEDYKSGEYVKINDYKAFIPSKINHNWGWDDTKLDKLPNIQSGTIVTSEPI